jgi:hypothetical protein
MSLTSQIKQWFIKTLPGMNNKTEDLELQEKWVEMSQNTRHEPEPGAVVKRPPITYYNETSLGSGGMVGLYRLHTSGGDNIAVGVHGTKAYVGVDSTGVMTEIRSGLTDGKRCSFQTYQDLMIAGNGYDNCWVYDGSTDNVTWELGACKARPPVAGGDLDAEATYYYSVTFVVNAVEMISGAVSNTVTTTAANKKVEITHIPLGPPGCTERKIYRTEGDGSSLKLLTTVTDNDSTVLETANNSESLNVFDDVADGSLGAAMDAVTDAMPKGNKLNLHRERLFITGDPNNRSKIYYSDPYLPHYILVNTDLMYMEVSPEDGDVIQDIPIQMGTMCCIKKNTIRKLHVTSPVSGADPDTWFAEDPISFTGARAQWSIVQTPYGIIFLGWNSWYLFDGAKVTPIIDEFNTDNILESQYENVFAYWTQQGVLLACYTDTETGGQDNNRIMRYNIKRQALSMDILNVNVIHALTGGDEGGGVLYGGSVDGYIYRAVEADFWYRLRSKSTAESGTKYNTFVGGTSSAPYIEIGSIASAEAIPDDVCIFWEGTDTEPGAGWEEVTDYVGKYIRIDDTEVVGTIVDTGSVGGDTTNSYPVIYLRLFKKITGTTEYVLPEGAIVFYDETTIPVGWAAGMNNAYIRLGNSSNAGTVGSVYLISSDDTPAETGYPLNNVVTMRLMKKVGEEGGWDGQDNHIYVPTLAAISTGGFEDKSDTYTKLFLRSSADGTIATVDKGNDLSLDVIQFPNTAHVGSADVYDGNENTSWGASGSGNGSTSNLYSDHIFAEPMDISSLKFKYYSYASTGGQYDRDADANHTLYYTNDYGTTWTAITNGAVTLSKHNATGESYSGTRNLSSTASSTSLWDGSTGGTPAHTGTGWSGQDLSACTGIRWHGYGRAAYSGGGSAEYNIQMYELVVEAASKAVTMNLARKVLGKMQDYNEALVTPATNGIWVSPQSNIKAEELKLLFWNETRASADNIIFFFRTGSIQASLDAVATVASDDGGDLLFTTASHGLSNGDRVNFGDSTTAPTGLTTAIMYYVVGKTDNTFKVALTGSGDAITYTNAGTTVKYKKWMPAAGLHNPNGTDLTALTLPAWTEYCIVYIAADTTVSNPKVYTVGGYAVKYSYRKGSLNAETAVEYIYDIGFRNFDAPMVDKILKKICVWHEGSAGSYIVYWKTDLHYKDANGIWMDEYDSDPTGLKSFTVDLSVETQQTRWESFFPDFAVGRQVSFKIYKNDLNDFKLKEMKGLYSPEPIIV